MKIKKGSDVLGNAIKPGDYIVYGAAKGSCAGLNIGRVIEFQNKKFKCDAIDVSWGRYARTGTENFLGEKRKPRPVYLQFSERICVIPAEIVPAALLEMLK